MFEQRESYATTYSPAPVGLKERSLRRPHRQNTFLQPAVRLPQLHVSLLTREGEGEELPVDLFRRSLPRSTFPSPVLPPRWRSTWAQPPLRATTPWPRPAPFAQLLRTGKHPALSQSIRAKQFNEPGRALERKVDGMVPCRHHETKRGTRQPAEFSGH